MSGFSPDWLALREPFDAAARAKDLAESFLAAIAPDGLIVDLGAGAGSNIAFLRARGHRWRHVDADRGLIAVARARFAGDERIGFTALDLARDLDAALEGAHAVTCAALLDLVSAGWAEDLVTTLAERRLPALIALSYDGRMRWTPGHRDDDFIAAAFHRDMSRDKGFGPALGPAATSFIASRLAAAGALLDCRPSDWRIGADDHAMLEAMIAGVSAAASAAAPTEASRIAAWAQDRRARSGLALEIGHQDLLARWA